MDGGFLIRFIGSEGNVQEVRCASVFFCYDSIQYRTNDGITRDMPPFSKIEIISERGDEEICQQIEEDDEYRLKNG